MSGLFAKTHVTNSDRDKFPHRKPNFARLHPYIFMWINGRLKMQRTGVALASFILAVLVSLGVSYFLWGQSADSGGASLDVSDIESLRVRLANIEAQLNIETSGGSESYISPEDFEAILARLDMVERKVKELSLLELAGSDPANPGIRENLSNVAEDKAREVYKNMKEEERRKQQEEWQRRREEHERETQEWLVNVYNDQLAKITKELSLTPNQEVGVREALNVRKDSVQKVYAGYRMSEEERRSNAIPSWDDINKTFEASMKQILDQQQFKTYKEKHLDDFNRGRGRRGRGR